MLVSWSLRYWTKAECCGEPVNLVGPIVLLTNFTSDHISSALGKNPFWNGSASPFWEGVRRGAQLLSASAASEAPEAMMNSRREIAIVSSPELLLSTAPTLNSYGKRGAGKSSLMSDATTHIGQLLTSLDRRPQVSFRCLSSQPIIIRLKASGWSTLQKWLALGISSYRAPGTNLASWRIAGSVPSGSWAPRSANVGT